MFVAESSLGFIPFIDTSSYKDESFLICVSLQPKECFLIQPKEKKEDATKSRKRKKVMFTISYSAMAPCSLHHFYILYFGVTTIVIPTPEKQKL
jgi:hypothetical protein